MKKMFLQGRALVIVAAVVGLAGCGGGSSQTNFSVSGTITGLTSGQLNLTDGTSLLALGGGASTFLFPQRLPNGAAYSVVIQTQPVDQPSSPANLICRVTNANGIIAGSDVSNVQITCAPSRTLGGTVSGLTSDGLVLTNGSNKVEIPKGATSFVFPAKVGDGFSYGVTVLAQPASQNCTVQNGAGTVNGNDVNNVLVACQ